MRKQRGRQSPPRHDNCYVCGPEASGLRLSYEVQEDGSVRTMFDCDARYQGYEDRIHGGVIAMIFDDAMTQCLLSRDVFGVTGRLNVAFRIPIRLNEPSEIRAFVVSQTENLYRLRAEWRQRGKLRAHAEAKFQAQPKSDEARSTQPRGPV